MILRVRVPEIFDFEFLPISPNEKISTCNLIFFYDRRKKNTIDRVDKKLLHNVKFPDNSPTVPGTPPQHSAKVGILSKCYLHHAVLLVLNTCMDTNMQFTIKQF